MTGGEVIEKKPTYRPRCVENFKHTLLTIYFNLFTIAIFYCWVIFFHKYSLEILRKLLVNVS